MGNLTYDKFVRSFDTYTEHEECICEKALNILRDCKISNKYKLILPLYRRFSISNNAILLHNYIEDPLWLYDTTDHDMMDRVRIHTRLKKGITDAYCKSHFGTSVLIMERGPQSNSISISIEKDDCYKMALTTDNSNSKKLTPAIDDGLKVSNKLKTLQDLTLDKVIVLNQSSLSINDTEFENGIKAHFPLVENGKFVVYYFFPNNIQTKPTQRYGYGGIFVVSEHFLSKDEKSFFLNVAFLLGNRLAIKSFQQRIKAEAIKSAKAAIMSRNMSHNLGSHVMFYIKQKLQSVSKIVGSNVLHNIIPGNLSDINEIQKKVEANTEIELPFLVGLGRFINYLQERQDYIATIATNYIPANSTISFKDFIFDELKPDLRYERHHPAGSENDAGWQPGNLLLDYIAYSEGYRKSDDIVIHYGEFDGRTPQNDSQAHLDFKDLRMFNIAVPGGVIGRQAIFSIIENILRNAAKHSGRRSDGKLALGMSLLKDSDFETLVKEKFCCKRQENAPIESGDKLIAKYEAILDKFHILHVKLDMPNKVEDIDTLVEKLGESYVEDDGRMKETSKGLKEMRISAAWLRGYTIDTNIPEGEPPVLAVYSEPYKENGKEIEYTKRDGTKAFMQSLSYILCIPKPCRVAFIADNSYCSLNKSIEAFGCKVFDRKNLDKEISEIANYEIVCMSEDDKGKVCPYISSRYIANKDKILRILNNLNAASAETIDYEIDKIYEEWLKEVCQNTSYKLLVADEKAENDNKKKGSVLNEDSEVVLTSIGEDKTSYDWNCDNAVVYLTHFKGLSDSGVKGQSYYTNILSAACLESVTGNNSTDRLIRQDDWTKEWKSKHISAGLAKVAIFDERIFSLFITRESKTNVDNLNVDNIKKVRSESIGRAAFNKALKQLYKIEPSDAMTLYNADDNKTLSILERYKVLYKHCIAQKNHERRIWAFDIRVLEESKEVEIVGYNVSISKCVGAFVDHKTDAVIPIAKIVRDKNDGYAVRLCDNKKVFEDGVSEIFDYITIHQGILDKIYGVFGIKSNDEEKRKITHAIHRCFSKSNTPESARDYLPNFIIHSGRSKPSENDMPQKQPFVQFAAIDHAVKDCKYTLVELLATAHYEENNNNN